VQFKDVIGQSAIKAKLTQMVSQNRLSHALLFLGREGTGPLPLAMAFTQYLVCEKVNQKEAQNSSEIDLFGEQTTSTANSENFDFTDSCGICSACKKAAQLIHPDIHFSFPAITGRSDKPKSNDFIVEWRAFVREHPYGNLYDWLQYIKAENKQGNISAEECREIIKMMSLKSFEADYKILIIWMPELLKEQGNRLLKLIEEPPPQTLFLFVAENEQQLLPTILSRVQLIKIAPLSQEEIEKALRLNYDATNETAERVAVESEGNFREALQLLQYADNDWERNLREWLNSCLKAGPAAQVKWIDEISKIGREKQKQFFKYFLHVIEFAVKSRMTDESSIMASHPSSLMDLADRFNKICKVEQLEAIATELDKAYYYIERNANAKLLFHALTIKLYHIISNKSVILAH